MRSAFTLSAWLPLLAAGAFACPLQASAQAFAADYGLAPSRGEAPGVGLSVQAGRNWFARVGAESGMSPHPHGLGIPSAASFPVVNIGGGYRWGDGRSLSLQLNRGTGQRLGLSLSYDWPRYYMRLSYDSSFAPAPQDSLRLSAGVRF
ncbi:MAG TPA: hypothetical protein VLI46_07875 [Ramlibacter sp.]|nr:hypothetical protein [Ramlibacter sp.]